MFNLIVNALVVFNILLRLPALFDPVSYGDECIYLTLGNAFNQGLVFYRDIHDNKPPLIYLLSALASGQLFWLRLMMIFVNSINVILIYHLANKLLKKPLAGIYASLIFIFLSLIPEGRIANGEIFMIMMATLGVLVALNANPKKPQRSWFLAGLCFSLAFLFKIPIVFDFLGFIFGWFFLLAFKPKKQKFNLKQYHNLFFILLGFILPIGLSLIYYSFKGAFEPYFRSALLQNIGYLSSWSGESGRIGLGFRGILLLAVIYLIYRWRSKLGFVVSLCALISFFSLYGVFLSQRPYPHYLLEIAPWFSLMLTASFYRPKKEVKLINLIFVLLTLGGLIGYRFWYYPHLPYYKNFFSFSLGRISKQQYFSFFGNEVDKNYQIAKFIKMKTDPKDRVFIWGDGACVYALSQRLPPGRFTINYHIYDFNGFGETLNSIINKKPPLIVLLEPIDQKFIALKNLLDQRYFKIKTINQAAIYQLTKYP